MTLLILQIEVPDLHGSEVEELRLLLKPSPDITASAPDERCASRVM
jgi:hypothetical protein